MMLPCCKLLAMLFVVEWLEIRNIRVRHVNEDQHTTSHHIAPHCMRLQTIKAHNWRNSEYTVKYSVWGKPHTTTTLLTDWNSRHLPWTADVQLLTDLAASLDSTHITATLVLSKLPVVQYSRYAACLSTLSWFMAAAICTHPSLIGFACCSPCVKLVWRRHFRLQLVYVCPVMSAEVGCMRSMHMEGVFEGLGNRWEGGVSLYRSFECLSSVRFLYPTWTAYCVRCSVENLRTPLGAGHGVACMTWYTPNKAAALFI